MTTLDFLKEQANFAFSELLVAVDGVTELESWAMLPSADDDYLHTSASPLGIVLHVASAKFIYGSVAFRESEVRWRDCAARIGAFEPNWTASVEYLKESHEYWMSTWADLPESQLETDVPHFSGSLWPAWKIIRMVTHHDSYHAGQIVVVRYATTVSGTPPPSEAADIRKYCQEMPSW